MPRTQWRTLITDSDPVSRTAVHQLLAEFGLRADYVRSGSDAVAVHRRDPYDIIFMGCHTRDIDGYRAAARIREIEGSGQHVWIVAMTEHATQSDLRKCLKTGMDDCVCRTVTRKGLHEALGRCEAALSAADAPPLAAVR